MLKKRIIPCLDVKDGRVVKGINFIDLVDAGDPVEQAKFYSENGADEICFLDISASLEERDTMLSVLKKTAEEVFIPLTVGGGIKSFRVNCIKRDNVIEKWRDWSCNIHPHNYYLEILTELGLIGIFIILFLIIQLLNLSCIKNNYLNSSDKLNNMLTPFILLFIAEMFPIRSSGSFFTTNNSVFIFLLLAIIVSISKNKNLN